MNALPNTIPRELEGQLRSRFPDLADVALKACADLIMYDKASHRTVIPDELRKKFGTSGLGPKNQSGLIFAVTKLRREILDLPDEILRLITMAKHETGASVSTIDLAEMLAKYRDLLVAAERLIPTGKTGPRWNPKARLIELLAKSLREMGEPVNAKKAGSLYQLVAVILEGFQISTTNLPRDIGEVLKHT